MDKRSNNGGKIILGMLKGKSMNTSVSSMAIRFNATAEEIEEVYSNEEEQSEQTNDSVPPIEKSSELESSPRRSILPLLGKKSGSTDTNSTSAQDSSPPSDPWRFLSDIKGKITKSVEVKLTEYKSRTMDNEGSPKITKPVKDSKDNSSLSDSEEVSESSISKTCGVISTTEGVEMSSDDETPSLSEEDKPNNDSTSLNATSNTNVRQRFRLTNRKSLSREGSVGIEFLENVQKINDGVTGQDSTEIESGVDVLADLNIANFEVDNENVLNITQISGSDIKDADFGNNEELETVFSPVGFVDLRRSMTEETSWYEVIYRFRAVIFTFVCLCLYFVLPISLYISGFIAGGLVLSVLWCLYIKLCLDHIPLKATGLPTQSILEIPAAKEYQPLRKYEGWINEYPEEYNPLTYHVSQTQSVYLRLQGNFLKVSHTRQKIPKRAMWNELEHKLIFTRHRIYNLLGAKILLLPEGLARVRHWSKKYPICIILNNDQINYEEEIKKVKEHTGKEVKRIDASHEVPQVFSKLVEHAEEQEPAIEAPTTTEEGEDIFENDDLEEFDIRTDFEEDDESHDFVHEWHDFPPDSVKVTPDETRLYFFGRTGREKEDWFRRFRNAAGRATQDDNPTIQDEYLAYMKLQKVLFRDIVEGSNAVSLQQVEEDGMENGWVNAMLARILFDCAREQMTIQRIKERIQRKLASVRLPHFIQELYCEQLNLGKSSPMILGNTKPVLNDRGLWIDLDISYEGLVVVILQTKVNLMKLKHPHCTEDKLIDGKPAIFHSDIDDSAESTTDDESGRLSTAKTVLDSKGYPVPGLGGTSNRSKKLMKMVDRIAESKFFQAATENKYIKKAMQEFSNTDLRLKVEFKKCVGKLVINIPPPPSDRIWFGFRVPPELLISAHPIVGDRNIGFMRVTSWIEKKIYKEFQKTFVIPNMEDLLIPVMSPKLTE